jgi:hypothetical protein
MSVSASTAKLWFNFLQIAIQQDLPIKWSAYEGWGSAEEIASLKFNTWWRQHGKALFEQSAEEPPDIAVISKTDKKLVVEIPLEMKIDDIKKRISEVVLANRVKKRIGSTLRFAPSGQVNYRTLIQYKRFLDIDFDPGNRGKTIDQKTALLLAQYEKLKKKGEKQRMTLRKAGKNATANRFFNREPETFDKEKLGGISSKRVSRWRLSGKHLLLNVAEGSFPGAGYHGDDLDKRLKERLSKIGRTDIGNVIPAQGGRGRAKNGS